MFRRGQLDDLDRGSKHRWFEWLTLLLRPSCVNTRQAMVSSERCAEPPHTHSNPESSPAFLLSRNNRIAI